MTDLKETIGLTLLAIPSAFGIWGALNTSLYSSIRLGVMQGSLEDMKHIKFGMNVSLGLILLFSLGLGLGFGKKGVIPALAMAGTGIGLYALYYYKVIHFKNSNSGKQYMRIYK